MNKGRTERKRTERWEAIPMMGNEKEKDIAMRGVERRTEEEEKGKNRTK